MSHVQAADTQDSASTLSLSINTDTAARLTPPPKQTHTHTHGRKMDCTDVSSAFQKDSQPPWKISMLNVLFS